MLQVCGRFEWSQGRCDRRGHQRVDAGRGQVRAQTKKRRMGTLAAVHCISLPAQTNVPACVTHPVLAPDDGVYIILCIALRLMTFTETHPPRSLLPLSLRMDGLLRLALATEGSGRGRAGDNERVHARQHRLVLRRRKR